MTKNYIYDIETYPNIFTIAIKCAETGDQWMYEISEWMNESAGLIKFMLSIQNDNMIGFNNVRFDYPVLHMIMQMRHSTVEDIYRKASAIIACKTPQDGWAHQIKVSDHYVRQIDLMLIHHFDNVARMTSLKNLEFNMRMDNISDLPFPPGTKLSAEQACILREYNWDDINATEMFYHKSKEQIAFREELDPYWINYNDTKIGKQYFINHLQDNGVQCYTRNEYGSRVPVQTPRTVIVLKDAVFDWIEFETPQFQSMVEWFRRQKIIETKGVFKDLHCVVEGFKYVFGLGGIHGSVSSQVVESDDDYCILDVDVTSYYPKLGIVNRLYPEHLGETFCDIYEDVFNQRKQHKKGTTRNAMLKLALNGVYGDSNNKYSPFYDPLYTMSITLNGQLLLCLLAEKLMHVDDLKVIQVNTDGITVKFPRRYQAEVDFICEMWEQLTNLNLEHVEYSRMIIRDVNNYIAVAVNGKVKRKGAYEYNRQWHQNHSALVVPKVAEQVILNGGVIRERIRDHKDKMDFMLRAKIPRSSKLFLEDRKGRMHKLQNLTRYYITTEQYGGELIKIMPELPSKPGSGERHFNQCVGYHAEPFNKIRPLSAPINYQWYEQEVEKLVSILD